MDIQQKHDDKVKEITISDGCLYVDLLSGLRLSGPLMSEDDMDRAIARNPRMIVSGHDAMSAPGMAFG